VKLLSLRIKFYALWRQWDSAIKLIQGLSRSSCKTLAPKNTNCTYNCSCNFSSWNCCKSCPKSVNLLSQLFLPANWIHIINYAECTTICWLAAYLPEAKWGGGQKYLWPASLPLVGDNIMKCTESCVVCLIQQSWNRASALICSSAPDSHYSNMLCGKCVLLEAVRRGGQMRPICQICDRRPVIEPEDFTQKWVCWPLTADCCTVTSCLRRNNASKSEPMISVLVKFVVWFEMG